MNGHVWVDGVLRPPGEATVDALDHGLTVGDGLFETIRAVGGRPVFWARHLGRLRRGAATMGIEPGVDDATLGGAVTAVLAADGLDAPGARARVRVTVTSGPGPLGPTRGAGPATVVVSAAPLAPPPDSLTVCTVPWARNERSPLAGVKCTSYADGVALLRHATAAGADEALLGDTTGRLSEAVTANVVVGVGGVALTPSLTAGPLPGIVREVLLDRGVVTEADLPLAVLATADEVLLTSATRGVVPVAAIDGRPVPLVGGPLLDAARAALAAAERDDLTAAPSALPR